MAENWAAIETPLEDHLTEVADDGVGDDDDAEDEPMSQNAVAAAAAAAVGVDDGEDEHDDCMVDVHSDA